VRDGDLGLAGESVGVRVDTMGWSVGVALEVMHAAVTPSKPAANTKATGFIHYAYGSNMLADGLKLSGPAYQLSTENRALRGPRQRVVRRPS